LSIELIDPLDYFTLAVSFGAVGVSAYTFLRKQKSEQFSIALDISNKLEENVNKLLGTETGTPARRSYALEYLNTLEFLAFLINNGELKNRSIIKYFKPTLIQETKRIFHDYPDIAKDETVFEEVRKLLRKLGEFPLD
jgi:hypothetical protein